MRVGDAVAMISFCALVPSRNHTQALPGVVAALRAARLPVIIIDDGSDASAAQAIAALHAPTAGVEVVRRPLNGGKGAAVMEGMRLARDRGFTHAVQVDADGQHDLGALPGLLAAAMKHPEALVSGHPIYDTSIPMGRKIGRWVTHLWVFAETLSFRITDSMCGFRVYPLAASLRVIDNERPGARMDFDTEIMVRLFWRGVAPLMVPVRVVYPAGNTSNFRLLADNARISAMHARLILTLLARLPSVLANRPPRLADESPHWAAMAERGAMWGLAFVALCHRLLGRRATLWAMAPIAGVFFLTGSAQRHASATYLERVLGHPPSIFGTFRHFMDFASRALDAFAAWSGAILPSAMDTAMEDGIVLEKGALLLVSHHGNAELSHALMPPTMGRRLTVLVHTRHAENYNRVLAAHRGEAAARMLQVTELGPETAILLRERIEAGEWVAMAADRVPVLSRDRVCTAPFLGEEAEFSEGPWILASLLGCPVHLLFCRRTEAGRWRLAIETFADKVELPRGNRTGALAAYAARYSARLERECREAPFQWYNFYDFWAKRTRMP